MKEKKFYQNYVIQSKDEVLTLMALLFNDGVSIYMDEMCDNFIQENDADSDYVDFSCSYLITEDVDNLISDWIGRYETAEELFNAEKVDKDFVISGIKDLYPKMVGDKDFKELLHKDKETFGSDVDFYDVDSLVNMFKMLS